jgi:hypothetical protein
VAVNCCVAPTWIVGFAGVTAIEVKVGGGAEITMLKTFVAFCTGFPESVTCAVKL